MGFVEIAMCFMISVFLFAAEKEGIMMAASQDEKRKGLEHAMSNQEAADILKKLVYSVGGRGNGKSHTMMRIDVALSKAIQSLEQDSQH